MKNQNLKYLSFAIAGALIGSGFGFFASQKMTSENIALDHEKSVKAPIVSNQDSPLQMKTNSEKSISNNAEANKLTESRRKSAISTAESWVQFRFVERGIPVKVGDDMLLSMRFMGEKCSLQVEPDLNGFLEWDFKRKEKDLNCGPDVLFNDKNSDAIKPLDRRSSGVLLFIAWDRKFLRSSELERTTDGVRVVVDATKIKCTLEMAPDSESLISRWKINDKGVKCVDEQGSQIKIPEETAL